VYCLCYIIPHIFTLLHIILPHTGPGSGLSTSSTDVSRKENGDPSQLAFSILEIGCGTSSLAKDMYGFWQLHKELFHEIQLRILPIDDDASTSSTVSVSKLSKPQSLAAPTTKRVRKSVHFNESANTFHCNCDHMYEEDSYDLWYSGKDMRDFKDDFSRCVKDILQFEVENQGHRSYCSVMHRIYEACCEVESEKDTGHIAKSDETLLNQWVKLTESRHGLEKKSNLVQAKDKSFRRLDLVDTVLFHQEECGDHRLHNDAYSEMIRGACENISRPSRLYARLLACAHAAAV
jgi:hypothetical protein